MITIVIVAPLVNSIIYQMFTYFYSILSQCIYESALGMSIKWVWVCMSVCCYIHICISYICTLCLVLLSLFLSGSASLSHCPTMNSDSHTHTPHSPTVPVVSVFSHRWVSKQSDIYLYFVFVRNLFSLFSHNRQSVQIFKTVWSLLLTLFRVISANIFRINSFN